MGLTHPASCECSEGMSTELFFKNRVTLSLTNTLNGLSLSDIFQTLSGYFCFAFVPGICCARLPEGNE